MSQWSILRNFLPNIYKKCCVYTNLIFDGIFNGSSKKYLNRKILVCNTVWPCLRVLKNYASFILISRKYLRLWISGIPQFGKVNIKNLRLRKVLLKTVINDRWNSFQSVMNKQYVLKYQIKNNCMQPWRQSLQIQIKWEFLGNETCP